MQGTIWVHDKTPQEWKAVQVSCSVHAPSTCKAPCALFCYCQIVGLCFFSVRHKGLDSFGKWTGFQSNGKKLTPSSMLMANICHVHMPATLQGVKQLLHQLLMCGDIDKQLLESCPRFLMPPPLWVECSCVRTWSTSPSCCCWAALFLLPC